MTDEQGDKIIELLEQLCDKIDEAIEKIDNVSTPGVDYRIDEED